MSVNLLTEHHLEFLSLKGGCTGSSESTLVKSHIVGNHMSRLNYSLEVILEFSDYSIFISLRMFIIYLANGKDRD